MYTEPYSPTILSMQDDILDIQIKSPTARKTRRRRNLDDVFEPRDSPKGPLEKTLEMLFKRTPTVLQDDIVEPKIAKNGRYCEFIQYVTTFEMCDTICPQCNENKSLKLSLAKIDWYEWDKLVESYEGEILNEKPHGYGRD